MSGGLRYNNAGLAGKERCMESNGTNETECKWEGVECVDTGGIGLVQFMGKYGPLPGNGERVAVLRRDGKWQVATFVREGRLMATGLIKRGRKPQCEEDLRAIARCDTRYVRVVRAMETGFYADPHDGVVEMLDSEGVRFWTRLPEMLGDDERER